MIMQWDEVGRFDPGCALVRKAVAGPCSGCHELATSRPEHVLKWALQTQDAIVMRVSFLSSFVLARRAVVAGLVLLLPALTPGPAAAANPAETFVADNIQRGLQILNNR